MYSIATVCSSIVYETTSVELYFVVILNTLITYSKFKFCHFKMSSNSKRPADGNANSILRYFGPDKKVKSSEEDLGQRKSSLSVSPDSKVNEVEDTGDFDSENNEDESRALIGVLESGQFDDSSAEPEFILEDADLQTSDGSANIAEPRRYILDALSISTDAQSWDSILLELIVDATLKSSVESFLRKINSPNWIRGESKEDVDGFLTSSHSDWADHDPIVTAAWNRFRTKVVPRLESAPGEVAGLGRTDETLSKPSGPSRAILGALWHYPTFKTKKPRWGHCFDKSNPCLNHQYRKTGSSRSILTLDQIPIRSAYSATDHTFDDFWSNPAWGEIKEACMELSRDLTKDCPLLMVIGGDNLANLERLVLQDPNVEIVRAPLRINDHKVFNERPSIRIVRRKDTKEILQLVLVSSHLHWLFEGKSERHAAYLDLLWNAALSFGGLKIASEDHFSRFVQARTKKGDSDLERVKRLHVLQRAMELRRQEKTTGVNFPESLIRGMFPVQFQTYSKELEQMPKNSSFVHLFLGIWSKAGTATWTRRRNDPVWRATPEGQLWLAHVRGLAAKGRDIQRAMGFVNFRRVRFCRNKTRAILKTRQFARLKERGTTRIVEALESGLECQAKSSTLPERRRQAWNKHVVFYSAEFPGGLRWEEDGGPESDDFPYDERDHPAVNFGRTLNQRDKDALRAP